MYSKQFQHLINIFSLFSILLFSSTTSFAIYNGELVNPKSDLAGHNVIIDLWNGFGEDFTVCGGVIVDKDSILTAAHCVIESEGILRIRFATESKFMKPLPKGGLRVHSNAIVVHAGYEKSLKTDLEWENIPDLAIINFSEVRDRLSRSQEAIPSNYKPVVLSDQISFSKGNQVIITGPGWENDEGTLHNQLRSALVESEGPFSKTILSLRQGTSGACWGDSGSGAFVKNSSTGNLELVGIQTYLSGYPKGQESCLKATTNKYIKVAEYKDWITKASAYLRKLHPPKAIVFKNKFCDNFNDPKLNKLNPNLITGNETCELYKSVGADKVTFDFNFSYWPYPVNEGVPPEKVVISYTPFY